MVGGLSVAEWTLEDDVVIIDAEKVRIGPSLSRTLRPKRDATLRSSPRAICL
jgi:hypothetical protein